MSIASYLSLPTAETIVDFSLVYACKVYRFFNFPLLITTPKNSHGYSHVCESLGQSTEKNKREYYGTNRYQAYWEL